MLPPVVKPFLVGIVSASLMGAVVKPLFRSIVKETVVFALEVRKLAAEVSEEHSRQHSG